MRSSAHEREHLRVRPAPVRRALRARPRHGARPREPGRGLGVVGVYPPEDPKAADQPAKEGRIPFQWGQLFTKGLTVGTGQCPVKRYDEWLRDLIIRGEAHPGDIVSQELPLEEAPTGYDRFDKREDGWTKVVLHPAA